MPEIAEKIVHDLKFDFNCQYDDKDSIGRRYRRQDAIGTPYCITIDHQTLEDQYCDYQVSRFHGTGAGKY
ncbi:MAG: His/Gly/Thr/Pro-type tRNA ligase C-terminal domain-containing protein [Marinilabiliales bacterium]|nr:His/Gly/Thr/Pro-type tRNA ligase C-terminal domain-containing protein [Marinilabiliales bacterium]